LLSASWRSGFRDAAADLHPAKGGGIISECRAAFLEICTNGKKSVGRLAIRKALSASLMAALRDWLHVQLNKISRNHDLAKAITRPNFLDSWLPWLNDRWDNGTRNAWTLWREMRAEGFVGQSGVVSQGAQRRRLAEKANQSGLARPPSARVLAHLMTSAWDGLAKSEAILVAVIEENVPELVAARKAISDFQSMIRSKSATKLDDWIEMAKVGLVGSFVNGVEKDLPAVRNAIGSPWSNGQTEGQITRLKLIKRQMYGRAKLDLLQVRLVGAT